MLPNSMATRFPTQGTSDAVTAYQLHKSMHPQFAEAKKKLVDFTEHKLMRHLSTIEDEQQRSIVIELINRYRKGTIAVAWKKGRPLYVDLTKEK